MRRLYLHLAIWPTVLLITAYQVDWPHASARQPERLPSAQPGVVGVAGCAAASCHHGSAPGSRGSEYSAWMAVDPHAKAFQTLYKPESQRMHENLARYSSAYQKFAGAHENKLCLKCHGMGGDAPAALQGDGVGCERCHGPAEQWRTTHYLDGFDRSTPGFVDTRDLVTRAKTCMKCHVGDADQEVNHDLIAAGHPRLRFEFGAYYANYPRHWAETGEKAADPGFEARAWAVGQLISAQSALELLASRTQGKDPITKENKPWPEFAEYECAACHHGLVANSNQQKRDLAKLKAGRSFSTGVLPWGTWYDSALERVAGNLAPAKGAALDASIRRLAVGMEKRLPDREAVSREATALAGRLGKLIDTVKTGRFDEARVNQLMKTLADSDLVVRGWDGGTQIYLGLAAMHNAKCDLDPAFRNRSPVRKPLLDMRKDLLESFGRGRPLYDSPLQYNADKVTSDLEKVRRGLK